MFDKINIKINGKEFQIDKGKSLNNIKELVQDEYKYEIILAKVGNEYKELNYVVTKNEEIEFFDLTDKEANKIYVNGLIFLMTHTFKKLFQTQPKVNHSLDKGLYITTDITIDEELLNKLEEEMLRLTSLNLPIDKVITSRINTLQYYKSINEDVKYEIMKYNTNTFITLYKLEDSYNYLYSLMPINTSCLSHFKLTYLDEHSFVLRFPTIYVSDKIEEYTHRKNVYNLFKESKKWAKSIGLEYVKDLNKIVSSSKINDIIRLDESKKIYDIMNLANIISSNKNVRIVLIAGPSSSGKTTTCNRLSLSLKNCGMNPKMLSMDDFFVERVNTPLDKNGNPDYEILEAIDLKLFDETIKKLLTGENTDIPTYNFITGKKEFNETMTLEDNDILLIEGIHALNPELLKDIEEDEKVKIYLSALTELNIDKQNRISTTDNRLLRRIVRDNRTRGHNVEATLKSWQKVREGEENNIFPYQDLADYTLNTAMIYEIGVLKVYVEPLLYSVEPTSPYYNDAKRLLNFLRIFLPIPSERIPDDSILREFIGGSCFKV